MRNVLITLLRADLRLHDHPVFAQCALGDGSASSGALASVTHVLPVFVFDQQYVEIGGLKDIQKGPGAGSDAAGGARTRVGGFWRCGTHRTRWVAAWTETWRRNKQMFAAALFTKRLNGSLLPLF